MLPAPSGWRLGMLLNMAAYHTAPTTKKCLAPGVSSTEVEMPWPKAFFPPLKICCCSILALMALITLGAGTVA